MEIRLQNLISTISRMWGTSARTAMLFLGGNLFVVAISGVSGLLNGRWIEPEVLGEFQKYGILTGYLMFGIIFVDAAFQRHFPYYLGKDDPKKALEVAGHAKWWYLTMSYIGSGFFLILGILGLIENNHRAAIGWFVQIPIFFATVFGLYLKILYRSNDDFRVLNRNNIKFTAAGALALPAVFFYKYYGLAFRSLVQNISNLYFYQKHVPYKVSARYSKRGLIDLMKVSIPLQLPAFLDTHLLKATVSLVVLTYLDQKALGIYGMAVLLQGFLLVFSGSINQIFTTKLLLNYGSHDEFSESIRYMFKPTILLVLIGAFIVVVVNVCIGPVVQLALPKYLEVVPVFQILAFELLFDLLSSPFTLFTASLMVKQIVWLRVLKVLVTFSLLFAFHSSLTEIALVLMVAKGIHVIGGYYILISQNKK